MRHEVITSPSNPRVKRAVSLREARDRKRHNRILIDGPELIDRAIASGVACEELFVSQSWLDGSASGPPESLRRWLAQTPQMHVFALAPSALSKLQYGQRDLEAIAVAIPPDTALESAEHRIRSGERELYLVVDRVEKPGNFGAMLRTADAAGVAAVLVSDSVSEIWNPNAIRSSLGAIFTVPLVEGTEGDLSSWLRARGVHIYAARPDHGIDYASVDYPDRVAVVIGSEALGLQQRWRQPGVASIFIPMLGSMDSLNASVCGAVLLFEIVRQARSP